MRPPIPLAAAAGLASTILLPAAPAAPAAPPAGGFEQAEVVFSSLAPGIELAGTLTLPAAPGPSPAVALLGVAGPDDRDQTVGPHRGFAALAALLAESGIASLRWDDRGVGGSSGEYFAASYADLAADALGAVRRLAAEPSVDRSAIGVIGNSEGGAVGPLAAARSEEVAFVILLAGPGTNGVETIRLQLEAAIARMSVPAERAGELRSMFDRFIDIARRDPPTAETHAEMLAFLRRGGRSLFPPYAFIPADPEELAELLLGRWYRSQLAYDPAAVLPRLRVPVLALVGDKDAVLPADPHLDRLRAHLAASPDLTAEVLPGLNHLFQTAVTGSPLEYPLLAEAFAPAAARRISAWILERFDDAADAPAIEDLETSLAETERAFARAAGERDEEAFRSFMTADTVFATPHGNLRGPDAIVEQWAGFFAPQGPSIGWRPELVAVVGDGSVGLTTGPFWIEAPGAGGEVRRFTGTFFSVWRRDAAGAWKIALDSGTEAEPEPAAGGQEPPGGG